MEKRKKNVPKALIIPAEISSKYGDKSTLLSETIMTTEIAMNEETAEIAMNEGTAGIETIELTATAKHSEKQEVSERVRKRRTGFFQAPDKEIIAFRGDTVKIECELVNNDDFTWFINNKPAREDSRCTEEVDSLIRILTIINISLDDNETVIVAKVGDIVAETIIRVEDTPVEIVELLPRRSFGKCGEDVTLAVSVTHPGYSVIWEFNGEELSQDDENYVIVAKANTYALTIKNATYGHAGRYSIKVDSLETSTMLIMQGAPVLAQQEPEIVDFEAHENLILNIPYRAVPEPVVNCFLNNQPLLIGTKLTLEIASDMVQFCKRKTNKNDSGEYTFKISNEFGEAVKTFIANVKGKINCYRIF